MVPVYCSASLPQMPQASMRRSAVSSVSSGTGSSRSSSCRGPVCTIARLVRGGMVDHAYSTDRGAGCQTLTGPGTPPTAGAIALAHLTLRRDPLEVLECLADEPGAYLLEVPDPVHPTAILGCRPVAELRIASDDRDPPRAIARLVQAEAHAGARPPFP